MVTTMATRISKNQYRFNQQNGNFTCTSSSLHFYVTKVDLRLTLFYLCWFFNFLCLLGLEDKRTYESTCNLGQKVLRIFTFLTTECLSHGFGTAMTLLPSPHPGQSSLVGIRKDPAGLQHCFFWGQGGVFCSCQHFQELYLETRHGNVSTILSKIVHVG